MGLNNKKRWCSFYNDDEDDATNYIDHDKMHAYFTLMMIMTMSNLYWRWEWWRIIMMMIWMMMSNIHWWRECRCLLMMAMWKTMMCFVLMLCIIGRVCIYDCDLLMMLWSFNTWRVCLMHAYRVVSRNHYDEMTTKVQ